MRSLVVAFVSIAVAACLVSTVPPQCSAASDDLPASSAWTGSVLRMGFMEKVDSLNPMIGMTDASRFFYSLVYDSLFSYGNDLETVGNLATGWSVVPVTDPELVASGEPYGSVWEYEITHNAEWHDGEPLTAADVEWVLDLNSAYFEYFWSSQPYAYFMDYAEAVDDYTVRVHYFDRSTGEPQPVAYGDTINIPMIPRHLLTSYTPGDIAFSWDGTFDGIDPPLVGTGPFMAGPDLYDDWLNADVITLLANPDHHWADDRGEEVQLDAVSMYFYDDATAMELALRMGELDVAQLPPQNFISLREDVLSGDIENVEVFDGPKCTQLWSSVAINQNYAGPNPARLDPAVRQAMAMCTNKEYIVDQFYYGLADVGSTLISTAGGEWHYEPTVDEVYEFDVDAAAQLLEDAGYLYTVESPEVRVATADSYAVQQGLVAEGTPLEFDLMVVIERPEDRDIAAYLVDAWSGAGIQLMYRVMTEAAMWTYIYSYNYDLAILPWSSDPDPNRMLFIQSSYAWNGWAEIRYDNASYDASYSASVTSMDFEERLAHVHDCQRTHYLDVGHIVLAYQYQRYAWRTDTLSGWGDWAADPGRSLDAYWGVHPLLFDLYSQFSYALVEYEREDAFSMLVPDGWTLQEDETIGDTEFDLTLRGEAHGDFQTNILLDSDRMSGVQESREYLENEMEAGLEELEAEGVPTTPIGSTQYWEGANYSALRFAYKWDQMDIVQDMTLYADRESGKMWVLVCSVHSDYYAVYETMFQEIAMSLDVVEHEVLSVAMYAAIGAIAAAAVVAVVAALYLMKSRKAVAPPPQPAQAPPPAQVCSACGSALPPGGAFCTRCGKGPEPPPPT
ncbi:MAG: ABC transporter substrate-binding protein [Candidatus Thermoplasmatota archaeon]